MNNMIVVAWKTSTPKLHCVLDIIDKPYQNNCSGAYLIKAYYKSHYLQYSPPYRKVDSAQFEHAVGERIYYPT